MIAIATASAITPVGGGLVDTMSALYLEGNPVAHRESYIAKSTGNEVARSTGSGVITQQVQGRAYFQTYSRNLVQRRNRAARARRRQVDGLAACFAWLNHTS